MNKINKNSTLREVLQIVGTDLLRDDFNSNIHVAMTMGNLKNDNIIFTDMRFPNELKAIKDRGGITIRVNRPYEIVDNTIKDGRFTAIPLTDAQMFSETHPSETSLDSAEFDYTIWNNEGIPELINEVRLILQKENLI